MPGARSQAPASQKSKIQKENKKERRVKSPEIKCR